MPRKARIDAPEVLHHVIGRGINRQKIFSEKKDYMNFLERLGDLLIETKHLAEGYSNPLFLRDGCTLSYSQEHISYTEGV